MISKCLLLLITACFSLSASAFELFGKGAYSKYFYDESTFEESISGNTGIAFSLFSGVRLEGRYTYIQKLENRIDVNINGVAATLSNRTTKMVIYSVNLDIELAGSRSAFKPFISLGVGALENRSSFRVIDPIVQDFPEIRRQRLAGDLGFGFRWQLGRYMFLEFEGMAYATDIDQPKPIINSHLTAGLRILVG